jgi:hypothetical protein
LLKDLHAYDSPDVTIRIILDNHSAQVSKETRAYLAGRPNLFKYADTPKHSSWPILSHAREDWGNWFGQIGLTQVSL